MHALESFGFGVEVGSKGESGCDRSGRHHVMSSTMDQPKLSAPPPSVGSDSCVKLRCHKDTVCPPGAFPLNILMSSRLSECLTVMSSHAVRKSPLLSSRRGDGSR